ncbi:hypothetical protein E2C01_086014 [Portunus trituberculatus]|uniref:Uncharacterized protein n=1 Tax=Portunus trituberculatus TaxID=210409 RepID=A0A5B7JAE7_PORTR|nr:hypothetical protein [Portunus trituberculatus]
MSVWHAIRHHSVRSAIEYSPGSTPRHCVPRIPKARLSGLHRRRTHHIGGQGAQTHTLAEQTRSLTSDAMFLFTWEFSCIFSSTAYVHGRQSTTTITTITTTTTQQDKGWTCEVWSVATQQQVPQN